MLDEKLTGMSESIRFIAPRLVGDRFADHGIPLEVLKELAVLEAFLVDIAKWLYLEDHPERKRSPRGFTEGLSLKLTAVAQGSVIPEVSLVVDDPELFATESQEYLEKARESFFAAIEAAKKNQSSITEHLPGWLLGYFDRLGRGLREDERIEFNPENPETPASLTKATRKRLILASSPVRMTDEVTLRGAIPKADQNNMTFELHVINGPKVTAAFDSQHLPTVLEAFTGYQSGVKVVLRGIGRFNRYSRLQSVESIDHLSVLEANDISARLEELKGLKDGWLDGSLGLAPEESALKWLVNCFESFYPDQYPLPYLYPTAEGGIQAEWSLGTKEITLDINLAQRSGYWHVLDLDTDADEEKEIPLGDLVGWRSLSEEIGRYVEDLQ